MYLSFKCIHIYSIVFDIEMLLGDINLYLLFKKKLKTFIPITEEQQQQHKQSHYQL